MATEKRFRDDQVRNPEVRYERRIANVRGIFYSMIVLVVLAVLLHLVVAGLFKAFYKDYLPRDVMISPIKTAEPHRLPPEPRLQPDPVGDLKKLRQQEDEILQNYGWVDRAQGVVRIPIARALDLATKQPIPGLTSTTAKSGAAKGK